MLRQSSIIQLSITSMVNSCDVSRLMELFNINIMMQEVAIRFLREHHIKFQAIRSIHNIVMMLQIVVIVLDEFVMLLLQLLESLMYRCVNQLIRMFVLLVHVVLLVKNGIVIRMRVLLMSLCVQLARSKQPILEGLSASFLCFQK